MTTENTSEAATSAEASAFVTHDSDSDRDWAMAHCGADALGSCSLWPVTGCQWALLQLRLMHHSLRGRIHALESAGVRQCTVCWDRDVSRWVDGFGLAQYVRSHGGARHPEVKLAGRCPMSW